MKLKQTLILAIFVIALSLFAFSQATRTVVFQDPNPREDIDHYTLKWGLVQGGPYPNTLDLAMPNPAPAPGEDLTFSNVEVAIGPGTYYAVVSCTNLDDVESPNSNEATFNLLDTPLTIINLRIVRPE